MDLANISGALGYNLDIVVERQILECRDMIKRNIENCLIFLFGSVAKGSVTPSSDIDILIILRDKEISSKERKEIRIDLNSKVLDIKGCYKEIDIKVYGEIDFLNKTKDITFEGAILNTLINITNCISINKLNGKRLTKDFVKSDLDFSNNYFECVREDIERGKTKETTVRYCYRMISTLLRYLIRKNYGLKCNEKDLSIMCKKLGIVTGLSLCKQLTETNNLISYENDSEYYPSNEEIKQIIINSIEFRDYVEELFL